MKTKNVLIGLMLMLSAITVEAQTSEQDKRIEQVIQEAKSLRMQVDDMESRFDHVAGLNNSAGVLYGLGFVSVVVYSANEEPIYLITAGVLGGLGTAILVLSANTLSNKLGKKKKKVSFE